MDLYWNTQDVLKETDEFLFLLFLNFFSHLYSWFCSNTSVVVRRFFFRESHTSGFSAASLDHSCSPSRLWIEHHESKSESTFAESSFLLLSKRQLLMFCKIALRLQFNFSLSCGIQLVHPFVQDPYSQFKHCVSCSNASLFVLGFLCSSQYIQMTYIMAGNETVANCRHASLNGMCFFYTPEKITTWLKRINPLK